MSQAVAARRLRGPVLTVAAVGAATLALRLRDPHVPGSWGLCPYAALTGLDCPGCGSLRAVNLLTHGDLVGAASSNLLLVLALPVVAVLWLGALRGALSADPPAPTTRGWSPRTVVLVAGLAVVVVAFTVLRNLPAGAWLHS